MRILILSQYYEPEPLPKPSDLAQALAERGHVVSVITGFPNYPSGRLYPGYRFCLLQKEKINGVPLVRTFTFPYHGRSSLGRIFNYVSFMVSGVLGVFFSPPCDLIYVWHPPLTIGLTAWVIGLLKRAPFVYDVQDIWPESLTAAGKMTNSLVIWAMHRMEQFIYKRAKHLLVVTAGAKNNLVKKGISAGKITVAGLWVDEDRFLQESEKKAVDVRSRYGLGGRFVIMYAGNMGYLQGLETILSCANALRKEERIVFVLVGDGVDRERLVSQVQELALPNVVFIESQPTSAIPAFLSRADALLVHLKHSELSDLVVPGKTLAYLASGRPIIMAMNGAAGELIRQANAGVVIPPEDPQEMAKAVLYLSRLSHSERAALGENGRSYLVTHFSKEKVLKHYEDIFLRASGC